MKLGFAGPYSGARHQFMTTGHHRLTVPSNPEYSAGQPRMMIREVENVLGRSISAGEWQALF
jgi:hypothetical protein